MISKILTVTLLFLGSHITSVLAAEKLLKKKDTFSQNDTQSQITNREQTEAYSNFTTPGTSWKAPKGYDVVAFSTNPLVFAFNHYPLCFDYIQLQKGLSHEIRFDFAVKARHVMMHNLNDPGFEFPTYRYTGYSLDYTLKKTARKAYTQNWRYMYKGIQFRYSSRDLNRMDLDIRNKTTEIVFRDVVHPHSDVFDMVFLYGMQVRKKRLFMDAYTGMGVGYKTFSSPYDTKTFEYLDNRFKESRWNTFYIPLRLGVRIGVIM